MTIYSPFNTPDGSKHWWKPAKLYQDPLVDPYSQNYPIQVTEVSGQYNQILVTWSAVPGATSYNLYGSYSPTDNQILVNSIPITGTLYTVQVPINTDGVRPYFFVSYIKNSVETFLTTVGITFPDYDVFDDRPLEEETSDFYLLDTEELKFYLEEIRKRVLGVLDAHGEEFTVYIRRLTGVPCECVADVPGIVNDTATGVPREYQGPQRCPYCFGTGIYGGYYRGISVTGAYMARLEQIAREQLGLRLKVQSDLILPWAPRIKNRDIFVRKNTGEKYIISDVNPGDVIRGKICSQIATYNLLEYTDILYTITDSAIDAALAKAKLAEDGFRIFA